MNCKNCHEPLEPGAVYCGNCGQQVQQDPANLSGQLNQQPNSGGTAVAATIPNYAISLPQQHAGETPAILSLIFGIIGIAGAGFLIPIIGLVFGVAGLVFGTIARRMSPRRLATIGLIFACLSIAAGLSALVYNLQHVESAHKLAKTGQSNASYKVLSKLSTNCYSFNLIDQYNISNSLDNCSATMFNGQSFANSTNVYKIIATKAGTNDPNEFNQLAKQAINNDIQTNLPGFKVTSQGPTSFAGSIAYSVYAYNQAQNTAVVEAGVLHQTKNGDNAFDIVHAINGSNVNLQALEAEWQWK